MNSLMETVFKEEITKKGLAHLRVKYPEDLKIDMSDDVEFKAARKTRTEKNKLVEAINRRRLDITAELKTYSDGVIGTIGTIYDVVTIPFEKEDQRRKNEAKKVAEALEVKLNGERAAIKAIGDFYASAKGKPSDEISGIIEAVDLIEVDHFDKELIHEAIDIKKETLEKLDALLSDTKSREILDAEREKLAEESAAAAKKAVIVERLNTLKMIPTTMFGKSSKDIGKKITSIENFSITEEEFGDMVGEGENAVMNVVAQLKVMESQQKTVEEASKIKAEKEAEDAQLEEERKQIRPEEEDKAEEKVKTEQEERESFEVEHQETKPVEEMIPSGCEDDLPFTEKEEDHPATKEDIIFQAFCSHWNELDMREKDPEVIAEAAFRAGVKWALLERTQSIKEIL